VATTRRHHTAQEKVAILRRHLLDKVPVSDVCEQYGLHPTVFYRWQKQFFENGAAAFQDPTRRDLAHKRRIGVLEKKLARKHEVLSELLEEHVRLKNELGEP